MRRWSLSDLALARPVTVGMLLIAIILLGAIATFRLPLAFLPAESVSQVRISVNLSANSPEVLEREVIRPLEEAVAGVRDLEKIRVSSGTWGVRLNLEFRPGTDIDARKIELRERLDRARGSLPADVQNIELVSSQGSADEPIMRVRIAGDDQLDSQYYLIQQRVIRAIERIDGVARVEMEVLEPPELEVALDLDAARSQGIALGDVDMAVRSAQRGRSLGTLRRADADTGVRSPGPPAEPEYFATLPVERGVAGAASTTTTPSATTPSATTPSATTPSATTTAPNTIPTEPAPISQATAERDRHFARLGDVARVDLHPKEQRRGSRLNGRPAINLEVFADAGASPVEVSKAVREVVDGLHGDPALDGIEVAVFEDQGELILQTLGDLRDTGIYGGLIGMVVLFGFLHRWRTTLIASLCVPLSVLVACGVLFVRGAELDCIVLLGLVLGVGMLIDNAVVIVEAIEQRTQQSASAAHGRGGMSMLEAAREGAREVGLATVASTMTSVIVFLPMIVGGGHSRMYTYMAPLGATFVTALLASLLVSQMAVPMLVAWRELGGREGREREPTRLGETAPLGKPVRNWLLEPLSRLYARFIAWSIRHPRLILLVGLVACASAVYPAKNMQVDMGMQERMVAMPIRLELTGSRGYEDVHARVIVAEKALLERKQELGIGTLTCRYRDWGAWCDVFPAASVESEQEMSDLKQALSLALPEQAGVRYHIGERDDWRMMSNRDPREIQFVIRGEDMATLNRLAEQLAAHLATRLPKGDVDQPEGGGYDTISGPFNEGNQELVVKLDPDRLRRLGVHANEVADLVALGFQGVGLGRIRGARGEVELRLATGSLRAGADDDGPGLAELEDLRIPITDAQGARREVPLAAIADIELARSPFWIQRVDRQTEVRMKVRFFSSDRDHNKAMLEWAREGFVVPAGYSIGEGSQWGMEQGEMIELLINLGLCLILVYAVMASLFESFLQPAAILVTSLLGCFGAPWAMWASQTTFDLVAVIGLFILIGIIVNNGIMLIDKVTLLRASGMPRDQALARAGRDRLRPVLMTVLTTVFGLVPMLLHHPTLAGVYYHSIAIIIAAGLTTSTLMTLVFLPSAYVLVEDFAFEARRVWRWIVRPRRPT